MYMKNFEFKFSNCDPIIYLSNGIELSIENEENHNEKTVTTTRRVTISTKETHEFLQAFLKEVYDNYVEKKYKQYDTQERDTRYYLTLKCDDAINNKDYRWKKYDLNVERQFDSLFFPQKNEIIRLIDDFKNKEGMFKKKCIPYKLSFLLHGVPGTGKTTFLKALSNYTNRHIVNISLPLIETNEQLIEIFHSDNMQVHGN